MSAVVLRTEPTRQHVLSKTLRKRDYTRRPEFGDFHILQRQIFVSDKSRATPGEAAKGVTNEWGGRPAYGRVRAHLHLPIHTNWFRQRAAGRPIHLILNRLLANFHEIPRGPCASLPSPRRRRRRRSRAVRTSDGYGHNLSDRRRGRLHSLCL
ncbi:hypothetical protein EVAR_89661_1 [Eumeta japonica]|uniref:Uncharacterized protein n=1 Tax=Eumeta variegata TaxID=151549 RepID=A0A4C1YDZ9_EUMVA|nr:hypothetical protein EVAR_89661_1 [Eumeta japonica]